MDSDLHSLINGIAWKGDVRCDVPAFLEYHGCPNTAIHGAAVATAARQVAIRFGANSAVAEQAGWLHDVSAIFPASERVHIAQHFSIPVLEEEAAFPMIMHQKLSALLAEQVFWMSDRTMLDAIGCHTTLKANATMLDKVVFVADKLAWDQPGVPPYRDDLLVALDQSLDHAVLVYLRYLWEQRARLRVIHPWFRDAYLQMSESVRPRPTSGWAM